MIEIFHQIIKVISQENFPLICSDLLFSKGMSGPKRWQQNMTRQYKSSIQGLIERYQMGREKKVEEKQKEKPSSLWS